MWKQAAYVKFALRNPADGGASGNRVMAQFEIGAHSLSIRRHVDSCCD
jgi:hypothetical protein